MAFGQPSGQPAPAKQIERLLSLLMEAGHTSFRDARGAMGFTQRQGAGKFTLDEATALIDQLESSTDRDGGGLLPTPPPPAPTAGPKKVRTIREIPAETLAAELARRGWEVTPPPG